MLIFGHGVTIRGSVKDRGVKSDSINHIVVVQWFLLEKELPYWSKPGIHFARFEIISSIYGQIE